MHLKLVEESAERLRFRTTHGRGWFFLANGVALTVASAYAPDSSGWVFLLFAAPCLAIGGRAVLVRTELTIDLLAGRFEGRRGYWPSPQIYRGPTDQIKQVSLRRSRRSRSGNRSSDTDDWNWMVVLELEGWPSLVIYRSGIETAAEARFEHYARLLQVPALDHTGRTRSVTTEDILERLDRVEPEKPFILGQPSVPPESGSIVWRDNGAGATIELPRGGYLSGNWFALLIGTAFLTVGCICLSSATGLLPFVPSRVISWVGGVLFGGIGTLILGLLTVGLCSRQIVREEPDQLLFELNMLGRPLHSRRWPKQQVEKIVRMKVPGRVPSHGPTMSEKEKLGAQSGEVIVQRGEEVVRLARGADEQTQAWLCLTLQQLVAR